MKVGRLRNFEEEDRKKKEYYVTISEVNLCSSSRVKQSV